MPSEPVPRPARNRPPGGPDLQTQFEALLHAVWTLEADWRQEDRIDLQARLQREA